MALTPKFTPEKLRDFRTGKLQETTLKAFELEQSKLQNFAQHDDNIGLALVHLESFSLFKQRCDLDSYIMRDTFDGATPPDFQSSRYDFINQLISCRDWVTHGAPGPVMATVGRTIIDLLAIGQDESARMLTAASETVLDGQGYDWQTFYRDRKKNFPNMRDDKLIRQKLLPLAHELLAAERGEKINWQQYCIEADQDALNVARTVMSDNMAEVQDAVNTLCDLHIAWTFNPYGNKGALEGFEYEDWLHMLWPSSVFAYLRLRQKHGLMLPNLTHPLLAQTLGQFPERPFEPQAIPSWFLQVLAKLASLDSAFKKLSQLMLENNASIGKA